jgi:glycosyltransferase involved in cell wall biosynthesis
MIKIAPPAEEQHLHPVAPQKLPSVSVIIPCWNAEKWLARAIQSVIDQNYPDLEIIVIDDGSTDRSLEIIKSFGNKILWKSDLNRGACVARNVGFEFSHSGYVLFLDADDFLEGDFLLGLAREVAAKSPDIVFGPRAIESEVGSSRIFSCPDQNATKRDIASSIINYELVHTGTVLWRRGFLSALGCWDPKLGRLQDHFLHLRAISRCSSFSISQLGAYVWWDHHDVGNRVSKRRTTETELSVLHAYMENIGEVECLLTEDAKFDLALKIYFIALDLCRKSHRAEAESGFALCQALGLRLTEDAKLNLAQTLYFAALDLFRKSHRAEAELGFALCRGLGLRGHPGTFCHRLGCMILGLENKESLSLAKARLTRHLERIWIGSPEG